MLISSAFRDLAESNFIGERDEQNNPLPTKPGTQLKELATDLNSLEDLGFGDLEDNTEPMKIDGVVGHPEKEWSLRHVLGGGSLLGKACMAALMLGGHPKPLQKQGYVFGKHLALAWQACIDMQPFLLPTLPLGKEGIDWNVMDLWLIKILFPISLVQVHSSVWCPLRYCSTWSMTLRCTRRSRRAADRSTTSTTPKCTRRS